MSEWTFGYPDDKEIESRSNHLRDTYGYQWLDEMFRNAFPALKPIFKLWDYDNDLVLVLYKVKGSLLLERPANRYPREISLNRMENRVQIAEEAIDSIREIAKDL